MSPFQRDITKKLGSPKQPSNPFLEMVKFLLERIAPVHIDTESIRLCVCGCVWVCVERPIIQSFKSTNGSIWPFFFCLSFVSALIKQVNKSIDGTADDEEEGVPTEEAIRAGLELLKVKTKHQHEGKNLNNWLWTSISSASGVFVNCCLQL